MESLETTIDGLFIGEVVEHWSGKPPSAIHKIRTSQTLNVTKLGLVGDSQADLNVHGGAEKAIHHYAADHYPLWQSEGEIPADSDPAAFGENVSTQSITEDQVCIGDVFEFGTAIVQISQGRQPCWKLNNFTKNRQMAFLFQQTGRTGWYYRVLKSGQVTTSDRIKLIERFNEGWTVKKVTNARLTRKISREDAIILSRMEELAGGWRAAFLKMADRKFKEDTSARLDG